MHSESVALFKRTNGFFYVRFRGNGRDRWKSTGTKDRREAMRFLYELRGMQPERHTTKIDLHTFVAEFIPFVRRNLAENSSKRYDRVLRTFTEFVGNPGLSEITSRDVDSFKTSRLEAVKPVTVNTELRHLKAAFRYALRWEYLARSPFDGVRFLKIPERPPEHLTREEFTHLYAAVSEPWFRDVLLFAVTTGLRESEICYLRWEQVDILARCVRVENSTEFTTKSRRNRTVPLPDVTLNMLSGREVTGYVFTFRDRRLRQDLVSHTFKRYVRALGLDERLTFHSCRKTYASWLVQSGASLFAVQKLLGHVSPSTTMQYSAFMPNDLQEIVDKIELL